MIHITIRQITIKNTDYQLNGIVIHRGRTSQNAMNWHPSRSLRNIGRGKQITKDSGALNMKLKDSVEAKMERIGKCIKKMLKKRPDLDLVQMAKEIILKENLPCVGSDDKLLERVAKLFLIAHKNKSPLIDKETRRFIASAVIDRYLYDQQHQEKYDDDLNEKLEELFKELQEKRLPIDLTNEPDECVSDIDILE
eukprot:442118_1